MVGLDGAGRFSGIGWTPPGAGVAPGATGGRTGTAPAGFTGTTPAGRTGAAPGAAGAAGTPVTGGREGAGMAAGLTPGPRT